MGTGYTRNDTANNIADGNVINASDLDGEFDAVQAAFNGTTGHSHDGTSGEGPQIAAGGIASNAVTTAKILNGNVTTDKIANDAVTGDKLANNIQIAGTLGVTGETTLTTHLNMGDNDIIKLGASADLQIYHDGSRSIIQDNGTGNLRIQANNLELNNADNSENYLFAANNGAVTLYHDNSPKLATTSTGIDVTGGFTATDGCTITTADNTAQLTLTSTDADANEGPEAVFDRNSSSPADADRIGKLTFKGRNDANQVVEYGNIQSRIIDASDGTEDGRIIIQNIIAGDVAGVMENNGTETVFNENSKDLDFRIESDSNANAFFLEGSSSNVGIGTSSPDTNLDIERSSNDTGGIKVQNTNNSQSNAVAQVEISGGDNAHAKLLLECNSTNHSIRQDGSGNLKFFNASTERMRIDSAGHVTMPYQSAFYVETSSTQTDFGLSSTHTLAFGTERFDQNADISSNVFTAPVTGRYFLHTTLRFESIDSAATYYLWGIDTSNHDYVSIIDPNFSADVSYISVNQTTVADMDAGDTAKVVFQQVGGTQQTDLQGAGGYSYFCGHLVA
jgi:hypothetical protein